MKSYVNRKSHAFSKLTKIGELDQPADIKEKKNRKSLKIDNVKIPENNSTKTLKNRKSIKNEEISVQETNCIKTPKNIKSDMNRKSDAFSKLSKIDKQNQPANLEKTEKSYREIEVEHFYKNT